MLSSVLCMRVMAVSEQNTAAAFIQLELDGRPSFAGLGLAGWSCRDGLASDVAPGGPQWPITQQSWVCHVGMARANQELPLGIVGKEWMR